MFGTKLMQIGAILMQIGAKLVLIGAIVKIIGALKILNALYIYFLFFNMVSIITF